MSKKNVQDIYQSGANYYDFFVKLYPLIGFRINAYRKRAVELLQLKRGDFVVELGCGTGLNFPLILEKIGSEGRLIGVDISSKMLDHVRSRVEQAGWSNVELVQSDITEYTIPESVNGILSTGVFGYMPDYDRVIQAAEQALAPCGRIVILDGKQSKHLPAWLFKLFVFMGSPFGLSFDYFKKHPWESIEKYFQETTLEEKYGGLVYITSGEKRCR